MSTAVTSYYALILAISAGRDSHRRTLRCPSKLMVSLNSPAASLETVSDDLF